MGNRKLDKGVTSREVQLLWEKNFRNLSFSQICRIRLQKQKITNQFFSDSKTQKILCIDE